MWGVYVTRPTFNKFINGEQNEKLENEKKTLSYYPFNASERIYL